MICCEIIIAEEVLNAVSLHSIVLTGKHCVYWYDYDVFLFLTGLVRSC